MTIERAANKPGVGRFMAGLAFILAVWFVTLAMVPRLLDEPGQYILIGPQRTGIEALAATDVLFVGSGRGYIQIETSSKGTLSQLYGAGAWLILPASNGGCLSLRDGQKLVQGSRNSQ